MFKSLCYAYMFSRRGASPAHRYQHAAAARLHSSCINIIYADAGMLIVEKPPGLLSVPGIGETKVKRNVAAILDRWSREFPHELRLLAKQPSAFHTIKTLVQSGVTMTDIKAIDDGKSTARSKRKFRKKALQEGTLPFVATDDLFDIQQQCADISSLRDDYIIRPRVVHRLDEATSGILLFALTSAMQRALSIQFIARCVSKEYEALVDNRAFGILASPLASADNGIINTPLASSSHVPLLSHSAGEAAFMPDAVPATTEWHVVERQIGSVRLRLRPITGRTHQLRLHCALPPPYGLGAPILGDNFYGDPHACMDSFLPELQKNHVEYQRRMEGSSGSGTSTVQLIQQTVSALQCSGNAVTPSERLCLHAARLSIVDHFNYATQAMQSSGATAVPMTPPSSGAKSAIMSGLNPMQFEGFNIKWECRPEVVSDVERDVDERGEGHIRRRRCVDIQSNIPF